MHIDSKTVQNAIRILKMFSRQQSNGTLRTQTYISLERNPTVRVHRRAAGRALGIIQDLCKEYDVPPLQALVVNERRKRPGRGYDHAAHPYTDELVNKITSYHYDFVDMIKWVELSADWS